MNDIFKIYVSMNFCGDEYRYFFHLLVLSNVLFSVASFASKSNIKDAVEKTFSVNVLSVNTLQIKPKAKRDRSRRNKLGYKSGMKKAIVTLKAGDSIDLA